MAAANDGGLKIRVRLKGSGARALEELARNGIKAALGEEDGARFAEFCLTPRNLRAFARCLSRLEKAYMARRAGAEMKEERRQGK